MLTRPLAGRVSIVKLVAFDLDDTLAPSKSPLPPQMDVALRSLLDHVEVCIISGGQMGSSVRRCSTT